MVRFCTVRRQSLLTASVTTMMLNTMGPTGCHALTEEVNPTLNNNIENSDLKVNLEDLVQSDESSSPHSSRTTDYVVRKLADRIRPTKVQSAKEEWESFSEAEQTEWIKNKRVWYQGEYEKEKSKEEQNILDTKYPSDEDREAAFKELKKECDAFEGWLADDKNLEEDFVEDKVEKEIQKYEDAYKASTEELGEEDLQKKKEWEELLVEAETTLGSSFMGGDSEL